MSDIRILVVDDHAVVRQGLRAYLRMQTELSVVGDAGSAEHAAAIAEHLKPDVALVDMVMPGSDGSKAIRGIHRVSPHTRVLVLSSSSAPEHLRSALEAGALGYQLKEVSGPELVEAIRRTARGEACIDPRLAESLARALRRPPSQDPLAALSAREREVLLLIAEGLSNQQIAERLQIGEKTVKTHVGNVLAKLALDDRTQAAVWAWRRRLPERGGTGG